jgi:hypothetical protein
VGGQAALAAVATQHLIHADEVVAMGAQPGELGLKGLRCQHVIGHHGMSGFLDLVIRQYHLGWINAAG